MWLKTNQQEYKHPNSVILWNTLWRSAEQCHAEEPYSFRARAPSTILFLDSWDFQNTVVRPSSPAQVPSQTTLHTEKVFVCMCRVLVCNVWGLHKVLQGILNVLWGCMRLTMGSLGKDKMWRKKADKVNWEGTCMKKKKNGEETREKLFSCLLSLCLSDWALHFTTPVCSVFSLSPISSYLLCEKPFPISTDMKYTPVLVWVLKLDRTQTFCSAFLISASQSFTSSALLKEEKATQFYWLTEFYIELRQLGVIQ